MAEFRRPYHKAAPPEPVAPPPSVPEEPSPKEEPDTRPRCLHCDNLLVAHNDSISAWHCTGSRCIGCCYVLNAHGAPQLRPGYPVCPAA